MTAESGPPEKPEPVEVPAGLYAVEFMAFIGVILPRIGAYINRRHQG